MLLVYGGLISVLLEIITNDFLAFFFFLSMYFYVQKVLFWSR